MSQDEVAPGTASGSSHSTQDVRQVLGAFVGPVMLAIGIWLSSSAVSDHLTFDGAPRVDAVVVSVDYTKPTLHEDVSAMELLVPTDNGPTSVAVADPGSAPGDVSAHDKVVVRYDPERSADALFPSQLGWGKPLFPFGFTVISPCPPSRGRWPGATASTWSGPACAARVATTTA